MKNRLQFAHCSKLFATREEAKDFITSKQNIDIKRIPLYAEPRVLMYGDEKNPSIIIAMGSVGDGITQSNDNRTFFIDLDEINEKLLLLKEEEDGAVADIKDLQDALETVKSACGLEADGSYKKVNGDEIIEDAENLKEALELLSEYVNDYAIKNTLKPKDTNSIIFDLTQEEDGKVLEAKVRVPSDHIIKDKVVENDIFDSKRGLFLSIDLVKRDESIVLVVNGEDKDVIAFPNDQYVEKGEYDAETESIILTRCNGEQVIIDLKKVIGEWICSKDSSDVVLTKKRVEYESDEYGFEKPQDVLSAAIKYSKHPHNAAKRDEHDGGLYVSTLARDIEYQVGMNKYRPLQDVIDEIDTEVSSHEDNIIVKRHDGIFADVSLDYDRYNNTLLFKVNGDTKQNIELNSFELFGDPYFSYDKEKEELIISFKVTSGAKEEIRIPIADVFDEYVAYNTNHSITVTIKRNPSYSHSTFISADINISNKENNILEEIHGKNDDGEEIHALFVNGVSSNIKHNDSTVQIEIENLQFKDGVLTNDIHDVAESLSETKNALGKEIERSVNEDSELTEKINEVSGTTDIVTDKVENLIKTVGANEDGSVVDYTIEENTRFVVSNGTVRDNILSLDKQLAEITEKYPVTIKKVGDSNLLDSTIAYEYIISQGGDPIDKIQIKKQHPLKDVVVNDGEGSFTITYTDENGANVNKTVRLSDLFIERDFDKGLTVTDNTVNIHLNMDEDGDTKKYLSFDSKDHSLTLSGISSSFTAVSGAVGTATTRIDKITDSIGLSKNGEKVPYASPIENVSYVTNDNSIRNNILVLDTKLAETSGKTNDISGKVTTNITNITTVSGNVNTISGDVNTLRTDVEALSGTTNTLSDKITDIGSKVANLEADYEVEVVEEMQELSPEILAQYTFYQGKEKKHYLGTISIPKDQYLKSVEVKGSKLVWTYQLSNGDEKTISLDIADVILNASFGDGLMANSEGTVNVLISNSAESEKYFRLIQHAGSTHKVLEVYGITEAIRSEVDAEKTRAEVAENAISGDVKTISGDTAQINSNLTVLSNFVGNQSFETEGHPNYVKPSSTVSNAVITLDKSLYELSGKTLSDEEKISTISGDVNTISGKVTTNTTNISTVSGNVNTISGDVKTLRTDVNTVSNKVANLEADYEVEVVEEKQQDLEPEILAQYTFYQGGKNLGNIEIPNKYLTNVRRDGKAMYFQIGETKNNELKGDLDDFVSVTELTNGLTWNNGHAEILLDKSSEFTTITTDTHALKVTGVKSWVNGEITKEKDRAVAKENALESSITQSVNDLRTELSNDLNVSVSGSGTINLQDSKCQTKYVIKQGEKELGTICIPYDWYAKNFVLDGQTLTLNYVDQTNKAQTMSVDLSKFVTDDELTAKLDKANGDIAAAKTEVVRGTSSSHITIDKSVDETDKHTVYTVNETDIASKTSLDELNTKVITNNNNTINSIKDLSDRIDVINARTVTLAKDSSAKHLILGTATTANGATVYTLNETDIASASELATLKGDVNTITSQSEKATTIVNGSASDLLTITSVGDIHDSGLTYTISLNGETARKSDVTDSYKNATSNTKTQVDSMKSTLDTTIATLRNETITTITADSASAVKVTKGNRTYNVGLTIPSTEKYLTQDSKGLTTGTLDARLEQIEGNIIGNEYVATSPLSVSVSTAGQVKTATFSVGVDTGTTSTLTLENNKIKGKTPTLTYDAASNRLTFNNGKSSNVIELSGGSLITDMRVDEGKLVISYVKAGSTTPTDVEVNLSTLFALIEVNNTSTSAITLKLEDGTLGKRILSADVKISAKADNILKKDGNVLYVSNNDINASIDTKLSDTKSKVTALEAFSGTTTATVGALQNTLNTHQNQLNTIVADVAANKASISATNTTVGQINTKVNDLSDAVTENTAAVGSLDGKVDGLTSTVNTLASQVTNLNNRIDTVRGELNTLGTNLTSRIGTAEGKISSLETSVNTATTNIAALTTSVNDNKASITGITTNITNIYRTIDEITKGHIEPIEREIATLTQNIADIKADVNVIKNSYLTKDNIAAVVKDLISKGDIRVVSYDRDNLIVEGSDRLAYLNKKLDSGEF